MLMASLAVAVLTGAAAGCDVGAPAGREPHHELNFLDMADQPKMKPQRAVPRRVLPPAGAVAVDYYPYPYTADQGDLAGLRVKNPLEANAENIARGKFTFDNVCLVCHGPQGAGDGEVSKLFPKPPHLMRQRVRSWTDGRIFHVPMRGQGSMPSYAKQLEQDDLWAVVLYLRSLQAKLEVAPPAPGDDKKPAEADGGVPDAGVAGEDAGGGGSGGVDEDAGGGGAGGGDAAAGGAAADQDAGSGGATAKPATSGQPAGSAAPSAEAKPPAPPPPTPPPPPVKKEGQP